eukprot:1196357-Amphidinium_carterae.1
MGVAQPNLVPVVSTDFDFAVDFSCHAGSKVSPSDACRHFEGSVKTWESARYEVWCDGSYLIVKGLAAGAAVLLDQAGDFRISATPCSASSSTDAEFHALAVGCQLLAQVPPGVAHIM